MAAPVSGNASSVVVGADEVLLPRVIECAAAPDLTERRASA